LRGAFLSAALTNSGAGDGLSRLFRDCSFETGAGRGLGVGGQAKPILHVRVVVCT